MSSSSDYVYDDDDDDDDLNKAIAASLLDVGTKHGHVVNPTKKKPGSLDVGLSNAGNQCYYNAFIHWALSFDEVRDFLLNGEMAEMDHISRVKRINDRMREINKEIKQTNKSTQEKIAEKYARLQSHCITIIGQVGSSSVFEGYSFKNINSLVSKMKPEDNTNVIKDINDYTTATLNKGTKRQLPENMKNENDNQVNPMVEAFAYMIEFLKSTLDKINKSTFSEVYHTKADLENMGRCQWRIITDEQKRAFDYNNSQPTELKKLEELYVNGKPVYDEKKKQKMWPDTKTPLLKYWYDDPNDTAELASIFIDHLVLFEHNKTKFYDLFKYESTSTKVCYTDKPYADKFYDAALIQLPADARTGQLVSSIFNPKTIKQPITEFPNLCYLHNPNDNLKIVGLLFEYIKDNFITSELKKNKQPYNRWIEGFESLKDNQAEFDETYNNREFSKYVVINALKFATGADGVRIARKPLEKLEYTIKIIDETSLNLKTVCLHLGQGVGGGHWQFYRFEHDKKNSFVLLSDDKKKDCTPATCEDEIKTITINGSLFTYENPEYKPIESATPLELDNSMSDSIANISQSMSRVIEEVKPISTPIDDKTMAKSVVEVAKNITMVPISTTIDSSAMEGAVTSVAKNITAEVEVPALDNSEMSKSVSAVAKSISKEPLIVTVKRRGETLEITSNGKTYNMTFDLLIKLGVPLAHLTTAH